MPRVYRNYCAAHYARKATMTRNTDDGYSNHVPSDTLRDEVLTAQVGILLHALIAVRRRAKELLDAMEDAK